MINLPIELSLLSGADVQILEDTYSALRAKFNIGLECNLHFDINKFELTANPDTKIGGMISVNSTAPFHLVFMRKLYRASEAKGGIEREWYKYSVCAVIDLKTDFGRILIRRETFNDRLVALLHPCEMKFPDDKPFEHKFYVVTNDDTKAHLAMNWNFRNAVMEMGDNLMLETDNKTLIISDQMTVDVNQTVQLVEFANKIAALQI